eukprot:comp44137_c0_seq1/m.47504 comp44137_c0_seq1/g.47504  ORF comp44137_c0_seq1/g.47504 comp44137_c0_seq1/m.47504 type:complete len:133 (-) comp44137_c0_seq1:26-424(-)
MSTAQQVLRLYRNILRQIYLMPNELQRHGAWAEARGLFRMHASETDPKAIDALVGEGEAKLKYLRMVTPRMKGAKTEGGHKKKFVMVNGQLVEGSGESRDRAPISNWGMGNPDPAAVKKHWGLFRKQVRLGL